jgi:hypothetical protein
MKMQIEIEAEFIGQEENLEKAKDYIEELLKVAVEKEDIILKSFKGQIYKINGKPKKR